MRKGTVLSSSFFLCLSALLIVAMFITPLSRAVTNSIQLTPGQYHVTDATFVSSIQVRWTMAGTINVYIFSASQYSTWESEGYPNVPSSAIYTSIGPATGLYQTSVPTGEYYVVFSNIYGGGTKYVTYTLTFNTPWTPPTYTTVTESADPLYLNNAETITVNGVASCPYGDININTVLIKIGGINHTMTNLGSGHWSYSWSPSSLGTYSYTIYIGDTIGKWTTYTNSIQVTKAPLPTYTSISEIADPLYIGRTETITIHGITSAVGIQTVRFLFEGNNHSMTNLGSGNWQYSGWTPTATGTYSYMIYIQDGEGQWIAVAGSIEVTNKPLIDNNTLWIIIIVAIVVGSVVTITLLYYRSRNAKSQLTKPPTLTDSKKVEPLYPNVKPLPPTAPAPQVSKPPTQPTSSSLKFCVFCGNEIEQDATFCTQCGKQQRS